MEKGCRADEKSPNQKLRSRRAQPGSESGQELAQRIDPGGEQQGHDDVEAIEKYQFGVFGQVLHLGVVGREIAATGYPPDMGPEKPMHMGRVGVVFIVAMAVMMTVMIGPPQGSPLHGGAAPNGEQKLADPGGAVGLVGKVAMVNTGHRKHPSEI